MGYVEKNLAPGETVRYRARYHWITYRGVLILLLFAALLGLSSLYAQKASPEEGALPRAVAFLSLAFLFFALVAYVLRKVRASADEYVVTSRRVVRKYGLISHEVEQALLEKIQDITIRQGLMARLLGYGTVVVETASETGRIVFADIAGPESLRAALWGEQAAPSRPAVSPAPSTPARPTARERLAELDDLKARGLLTPEEYGAKREEILSAL